MNNHRSLVKRPRGFSLIEVMIALMVISVGLLGIAKMQALAMSNTQTAGSRALAALEAASMASAMHANPAYWAAGLAPASVTVSNSSTISHSTLNAQNIDCSAGNCTPVQVAGYDLGANNTNPNGWGQNLSTLLPGGQGKINCTTGVNAPITCTITVSWNEKYIALNQGAVDATKQNARPSLVLMVQP